MTSCNYERLITLSVIDFMQFQNLALLLSSTLCSHFDIFNYIQSCFIGLQVEDYHVAIAAVETCHVVEMSSTHLECTPPQDPPEQGVGHRLPVTVHAGKHLQYHVGEYTSHYPYGEHLKYHVVEYTSTQNSFIKEVQRVWKNNL